MREEGVHRGRGEKGREGGSNAKNNTVIRNNSYVNHTETFIYDL